MPCPARSHIARALECTRNGIVEFGTGLKLEVRTADVATSNEDATIRQKSGSMSLPADSHVSGRRECLGRGIVEFCMRRSAVTITKIPACN
jgi:hypothetical protein